MINLTLSDDEEIIVDNFAGGGGASLGIYRALNRPVNIALNHDQDALALHKANHPETVHVLQDVLEADPNELTQGRPVGLAWFSPDCTDHSKAKGGRPRRKYIRALAWVMVKWAVQVRPRTLYLENVEEFQGWGPLLPNGMRCPLRKGHTFKRFVAQLRNLGYAVEWKEIRGCWFGAPTLRKRLFMIARCDGKPILWPKRTHGKPDSAEVLSGELKPWPIAADCIDWSIPCPSIFLTRKEARALGVKRPLVRATMRRIARGIFKFVINCKEPFIVRVAHGEESPSGVKRWGKGVHPVTEPIGTIPASNEFAVTVPHITKFRTGSTGVAANESVPTVTSGGEQDRPGTGNAMGLVSATLIQSGYGERKGQKPRVPGLQKPLGTCVNGQKHALVTACLTEHANASSQRVFDVKESLRTQCSEVKGGHFALVQAFLAKHYGGHETPGADLGDGFDTITAKDHHGLVAANVIRHFKQSVGSDAGEPVGAIMAEGGGKTGIVTSHLSKLYGTTTGQDMRDSVHTITGQGNHIAEVRALLIKFYGEGGQDQSCADPMHTIPTKDRIGLVIIEGELWEISDIGMRMLEPRELFLAQGFPPDYVIEIVRWVKRGKKFVRASLPKHAQVRMCGNSVNPQVVQALVAANNPELARLRDLQAA